MAAVLHKFTFTTPEQALLFVRQVFATCDDVATFRDDSTVAVFDGHNRPQTEKLVKLAQSLGSAPLASEQRVSRAPTVPEPNEIIVEGVEDAEDD